MSAGESSVNWWLVAGGAVLVICGIAMVAVPWLFMESLVIWAGAGFIVSGVAGVASYLGHRRRCEAAGWTGVMAALDLLLGVLMILHPLVFASAIPWLLGVAFIVLGLVEVAGMMPFAKLVPESRIIAIISGVLSAVVGVMFIIWPTSLSLWVAAFALVRGITLVAMGLTARS